MADERLEAHTESPGDHRASEWGPGDEADLQDEFRNMARMLERAGYDGRLERADDADRQDAPDWPFGEKLRSMGGDIRKAVREGHGWHGNPDQLERVAQAYQETHQDEEDGDHTELAYTAARMVAGSAWETGRGLAARSMIAGKTTDWAPDLPSAGERAMEQVESITLELARELYMASEGPNSQDPGGAREIFRRAGEKLENAARDMELLSSGTPDPNHFAAELMRRDPEMSQSLHEEFRRGEWTMDGDASRAETAFQVFQESVSGLSDAHRADAAARLEKAMTAHLTAEPAEKGHGASDPAPQAETGAGSARTDLETGLAQNDRGLFMQGTEKLYRASQRLNGSGE